MIKGLGLIIGLLSVVSFAFADVAGDWSADASLAQSLQSSSQGTLNTWAQNQSSSNFPALPSYQANPSQESYAGNSGQMTTDAATAVSTDPNAQATVTQFNQGPQYPINSNTPFVQTAQTVQANAGGIIAGTYPGCTPSQQCQTTYQTQTCQYARTQNLNCTNTLQASVTYQPYQFDCNHIVTNSNMSYSEVPGAVNGVCVTGFYTAYLGLSTSSPYQTSGTITATLPPGVQGQVFMTLRGLDHGGDFNPSFDHLSLSESSSTGLPNFSIVNPPIIGGTDGNVLWGTTTANFSTPNNGELANVSYSYNLQVLGYSYSYRGRPYYFNPILNIQPAVIYISYPETPYQVPTVTTSWVNSCQNIPGFCTLQNQTCTNTNNPQYINGDPITEPCWQYTQNYTCNSNQPDTCTQYENTCNPISSTCNPAYDIDGVCVLYNETYSCPSQQCASQLTCGLDNFCINGDCYTDNASQSTDFGQDDAQTAAASQAAQEAADQMEGGSQSVQVFAGTEEDCSEAIIGFYNCCEDSGWGVNIGLASCSAAEKALGEDRQTTPNLTVEVGTYCAKSVLGQCIDTHEQYCDWGNGTGQTPPIGNILAYDVQVQGRQGQLGIGFGTGGSPDCSGLSIAQVQAINFNKIDFSNVATALQGEFNNNLPGGSTTQTNVENEIEQQEQNLGSGSQ